MPGFVRDERKKEPDFPPRVGSLVPYSVARRTQPVNNGGVPAVAETSSRDVLPAGEETEGGSGDEQAIRDQTE